MAWAIVINSMISIRRSPPSYLAINDCGFLSFLASCTWVRPAFSRVSINKAQKALCSAEVRVFEIPRRIAIRPGKMIPESDYPKSGYYLDSELCQPGEAVG